jgi:hypothetical protein
MGTQKRRQEMRSEITITRGTTVRCNRCNTASPFPKSESRAIRENNKAYRLQKMATLDCGHMDAHWVFVADNPEVDFE